MAQQTEQQKADWEIRQARTFEKWSSIYLKRAGYPTIGEGTEAGPIDKCFHNGINLINLIDALYKGTEYEQKKGKFKKAEKCIGPTKQVFRLENIALALKMYDGAGIPEKTVPRSITRGHIEAGNWTMTLGMMWCLILHANVVMNKYDGDAKGRDGLLLWCQKQCKGYKGIDGKPKNFSRNWKDGRVFNALLHHYYPDRVDYDSLDPANAKDNIEHAFKNFEEIGIERIVEVEDMLVEKPDDKQVMTYVSELFKFLSKQDFKQQAKDHMLRFLQFKKRIQGLCAEYEGGAKEYLAFVEKQKAGWAGAEQAESKQGAQQAIEDYKAYVTGEKPAYETKRIDLETLFANVQTELSQKGCVPWACPADMSPDALEEAGNELSGAARGYFDKIRKHRFSFIENPVQAVDEELKAEIVKAFEFFDKDNTGFLESDDFGPVMNAVGIPMPEAQREKAYACIAGADGKLSKDEYVKYMTAQFDTSDTAGNILASSGKLGDSEKFDFGAAGFTEEDLALAQEICPDGNFNALVASSFKAEDAGQQAS